MNGSSRFLHKAIRRGFEWVLDGLAGIGTFEKKDGTKKFANFKTSKIILHFEAQIKIFHLWNKKSAKLTRADVNGSSQFLDIAGFWMSTGRPYRNKLAPRKMTWEKDGTKKFSNFVQLRNFASQEQTGLPWSIILFRSSFVQKATVLGWKTRYSKKFEKESERACSTFKWKAREPEQNLGPY